MNIKRILCFGDSNTYGWAGSLAGPALRYPSSVRWTGRLGALLGPDWEILEEGLGGRTLRDPVTKEGNTIPPFLAPVFVRWITCPPAFSPICRWTQSLLCWAAMI